MDPSRNSEPESRYGTPNLSPIRIGNPNPKTQPHKTPATSPRRSLSSFAVFRRRSTPQQAAGLRWCLSRAVSASNVAQVRSSCL
jgi:hypothetical protein